MWNQTELGLAKSTPNSLWGPILLRNGSPCHRFELCGYGKASHGHPVAIGTIPGTKNAHFLLFVFRRRLARFARVSRDTPNGPSKLRRSRDQPRSRRGAPSRAPSAEELSLFRLARAPRARPDGFVRMEPERPSDFDATAERRLASTRVVASRNHGLFWGKSWRKIKQKSPLRRSPRPSD